MRRIWIDQPIKSAAAWFEDAVVTTCQCASETSRGLLSLGDDAPPLIKGRLNENVAPGWGLFDAHIRPPWAVIIVWQIDNPRPMPLGLVV
jgi:hypothetical protein